MLRFVSFSSVNSILVICRFSSCNSLSIVEKTGLNKGTVSNFLNYKSSNPTLDTLKMYCDAMECNLVIDIVPKEKEIIKDVKEQIKSAIS